MDGGEAVNIDLSQVRRLGEELGATPKRVEGAIKFAVRDAKRKAQAAVRVELVDATGLPRAAVKNRVKALRGSAGAWAGLNDVRVSTAYKRPRQVEGGVKVGPLVVKDAFVMRTKSGALVVMKRTGKGKAAIAPATIEIRDKVQPRLAARARDLERIFVDKFDAEVTRQLRRVR